MLAPRRSIEEILESNRRFELRRRLGAGGMGVVYEAYDRQRDAVIALKTLRRINPGALYLFKNEFRALADVTHPGLVTLYELLTIDDQWFFTMELLEGTDFLSYLRGDASRRELETIRERAGTETATAEPASSTPPAETLPTNESAGKYRKVADNRASPVPAEAITPLLSQLARALAALHAAGHLHCDIKPSNVLVTEEGRVVVLDYGVMTTVADQRSAEVSSTTSNTGRRSTFRGTPAYAAPEQAMGSPPTRASDWYAVGVMLYEALTGRRPFIGTSDGILAAKQSIAPPNVMQMHAEADPTLAALCMRLLTRDPEQRPGAAEILAAIGEASDDDVAPSIREVPSPVEDTIALVGRSRQLARLREAFDGSRSGNGIALRVEGRSGMGKTSLVSHFLDDLRAHEQALILTGRCYERESVPHQAVDGLVDSLCRFLLELPREEADLLMPLDVQAMARAFPVLERVGAVAQARRRSSVTAADPVELRRRAHRALRELFARIAEQQPLVLFIDDLQWGDVDSAPFLADLLEPPVPPLLLVVTYRSEEVESSALLQTLLSRAPPDEGALAATAKLSIGRLSLPEAGSLAETLLSAAGATADCAEQIARESGGNPFFVHELVRYVAASGGDAPEVPALADVLLARAAALSEDARALLQVVAVAGKPIPDAVARRAAGIGANHQRAIAELRTARLIRTSGGDDDLAIETYHDRIRESMVQNVAPHALTATHQGIADALLATATSDPEALAMHFAGAGDNASAAEYASIAGDKAAAALAFERAATYYELALELTDPTLRPTVASLGKRLGEALVNAGRGAESPEVFLAAAAAAEPAEARDLQVSAGSELLRAGRVEEGVEVLRAPLAAAGISLARSKAGAAFSLLTRRAFARVRGLGFERRSEREVAPQTLTEIDACHAAAAGLAMVDPLRGAYVQSRHLMSALKTGDAFRVGRALTYEGGFLCIPGKPARARVDKILHTVGTLAAELDNPYLEALHNTHVSLAEYQCGDWPAALEHADVAEEVYRTRCIGSAWERASVQLYGLWAMFWLGKLQEFTTRARLALRDARDRGDLYATVSLNIGLPAVAGLVLDDIEGTRARVAEASARWAHNDYHLQHYWTEMALALCDLYAGNGVAALERIEGEWPKLRGAFLLKVVMLRSEFHHIAARCAVTAAQQTGDERMWKTAKQYARRLARQPMPWCRPSSRLILAAVMHAQGRIGGAIAELAAAEQELRDVHTIGLAHAAMYRRGQLLGESDGANLIATAEEWAAAQQVANTPALLRFFAPGFDDAAAT